MTYIRYGEEMHMNVGEVLGNVLWGKNRSDESRNSSGREANQETKEGALISQEHTGENSAKEADADRSGMKLLAECLRELYDSDSFMKAIQRVTVLTGQYLQAEQSWCFWLKEEAIYNSFQWNADGTETESSGEEPGRLYFDLWDSLFDGREYVIIPDIHQTELVTDTLLERFEKIHTRSLILIPMFYKEQLLQMIVYYNIAAMPRMVEEFTDAMYCMLNMCISKVFERKKNFELTYYDALTGLYNRTKFWKDMRNATQEERQNTGIVLVHMRNLKKMNEKQGHEAGNQMLKRFAGQIDEIMPGEMVYRIGGSDFVFWMQHIRQEEFIDKVISLQDAFEAPGKAVANVAARWTEYAEDLYQLARQTDEDLYQVLEADERKTHFRQ